MRLKYILRRLLFLIVNLWIVVSLVFLMFRLIPGDPTAMYLDPLLSAETRAEILHRFGLDQPLHRQYVLYMNNLLRGNLGYSFYYNRPVSEIIWTFLPNTLILAFAGLLIAYFLGILGGVLLAWKRGSSFDTWGTLIPLTFRSAPIFWTGMVALMYFAFRLRWFPIGGMREAGYEASNLLQKYLSLDFLHHLVLPAVVAGLYYMGLPMLLTRTSMLEVYGEDFIDLARARGFSEARVMFKHALRNALLPVVTAAAVAIGLAVGGQIIIEVVFSWPGIGREIVQATQNRDYPMAQALFLISAIAVMGANFLADILYGLLDPRISYARK
jgi:peptide/nickel transport system permease protein